MTTNKQAKNWCFTLNNYTDAEYESVISVVEPRSTYFIVGKEVGDGGTPHLQGFAAFRGRHYFNALRKLFGSRVHLEVARGTALQNRSYCSKDGNFREGGEPPKEGPSKRTRDELGAEFAISIGSGSRGISEFADANPGTWYFSGHNLLRNALSIMPAVCRPDISVQWLYGPPGVGKSRKAHQDLPEAYIKDPRTKWWNGYLGEKAVIIDDFGPQGIDINHLLRWFDRYKCLVENKGGMIALIADTFIVTSNFHPKELFKLDGDPHPQIPALLRRIHVTHMLDLSDVPILNAQ